MRRDRWLVTLAWAALLAGGGWWGYARGRAQNERGQIVTPVSGRAFVPAPSLPPRPLLLRARNWSLSLRALHERGVETEEARLAALHRTWREAPEPVARQNAIFLAALTVSWDRARPWLERVLARGDADDREDALCALAFSGSAQAQAEFLRSALRPAAVEARRLADSVHEHDLLHERALLRSYRSLEVLFRGPYFRMHAVGHWTSWTPHPAALGEQAPPPLSMHATPAALDVLALELLPAWLRRYPGHPGSDDVARRVARIHARAGRALEAARWSRRASTLPDQDAAGGAFTDLLGIAEMVLTDDELECLLADPVEARLQQDVLHYVRLRRLAVRQSYAQALAATAAAARDDPQSRIAAAWHARWSAPPARGLDSGSKPLPQNDLLRRRTSPVALHRVESRDRRDGRTRRLGSGCYGFSPLLDDAVRLAPPPDTLTLDVWALAQQLRIWETLAELGRRAAACEGDPRADLLYKRAAIYFHERRAVYPVYGKRTRNFLWCLNSEGAHPLITRQTRFQFAAEVTSLLHAVAAFERVQREHPDWPDLDQAIFSRGLAWKKLLTDPSFVGQGWHRNTSQRRNAIREATAAFEACASRFPESPLTDDAVRAATYWRTNYSAAFSPF